MQAGLFFCIFTKRGAWSKYKMFDTDGYPYGTFWQLECCSLRGWKVGEAGFYTKLNVWGSLGLNFEYDGGPIIEIGGPIFLDKLRILEGSTSFREGSVLSPGLLFWGPCLAPFRFLEGGHLKFLRPHITISETQSYTPFFTKAELVPIICRDQASP